MQERVLEGGKRVRILWVLASPMPGRAVFRAVGTDGAPAEGLIQIAGGPFGGSKRQQPLVLDNHVPKRVSDLTFSIWVTPARQTRIRFETRHFRAPVFFLLAGGAVAAAAAIILVGSLI